MEYLIDIEELENEISDLKHRVLELETEKLKLKELCNEQADKIKEYEASLSRCNSALKGMIDYEIV